MSNSCAALCDEFYINMRLGHTDEDGHGPGHDHRLF